MEEGRSSFVELVWSPNYDGKQDWDQVDWVRIPVLLLTGRLMTKSFNSPDKLQYDFLYRKCPEQANLQRQEAD